MSVSKNVPNECTNIALETAKKHVDPQDTTLFASWFCPYVQRVWVAFEYLGIPYTYYEVDPYKKPKDLLEVSPKGLVPGLRFDNYNPPRALNESSVILDYLNDVAETSGAKHRLLPPPTNQYARALIRLQCDHITSNITPKFFRCVIAQGEEDQKLAREQYDQAVLSLVDLFGRAERELLGGGGTAGEGEQQALRRGLGLYTEGGEMGLADVMVAPWIYRTINLLKHYRGYTLPDNPKLQAWVKRLVEHPAFKATCSDEQAYIDYYARYASGTA